MASQTWEHFFWDTLYLSLPFSFPKQAVAAAEQVCGDITPGTTIKLVLQLTAPAHVSWLVAPGPMQSKNKADVSPRVPPKTDQITGVYSMQQYPAAGLFYIL